MNCKNHPDKVADFHCVKCQGYFCEPCVIVRKVSDDFTAYICKECGGKVELFLDKNAQRKPLPAKPALPVLPKSAGSPQSQIPPQQGKIINAIQVQEQSLDAINFWFHVPEVFFFPLKGKGIFIVIGFGALFFGITEIEHIAKGVNLPLLIVMGAYLAVYLFKTAEDSFYGSGCLQKFPNGHYWAEMGRILVSLLCAMIFYLFPAHLYFVYRGNFDVLFLSLLVVGTFLFPMAVIRIIISRRIIAASPWGVMTSIAKTIFAYGWVMILLFGFVALACFLNSEYFVTQDWGRAAWWALWVYLFISAARLLGIFARAYVGRINLRPRQK